MNLIDRKPSAFTLISKAGDEVRPSQHLQKASILTWGDQTMARESRQILTVEDLKVTRKIQEQALEDLLELKGMLDEGAEGISTVNGQALIKSQFEINSCYFNIINRLLHQKGNFTDDVVIKNDELGYSLQKRSLQRLQPRQWFNDEIINGYVSLINDRDMKNHT